MIKSAKKVNDRKKSHIPFRLNLLFFIVFMLFTALILRLGYLQIVRADEYRAEVERTENTTITGSVPRGEIFDANLKKLVGNEARNTITYTRGKSTNSTDMAELSLNLADYISMPHVSPFDSDEKRDITLRDMQDYYISTNLKELNKSLTDEEKKLSGSKSYQALLDKVSEDDVSDFSDKEKIATAIFKKMNASYSLSTVNIKNEDVTQEEIARVSESLGELPGIGTGTDWVRVYPEDNMLRSVLGGVTTEAQGIPSDKVSKYLAMGYSRNDRVGRTYLEEQYESVLRGTKSTIETETDTSGEIINQIQKFSGSKGDNLILTPDIDFQRTVEDIAKDSLAKREGRNKEIYIAAMNPKTGDILAMTGQKIGSDGEVQDDALGVVSNAYIPGSSIKGATILSAYMDGVLDSTNNTIVDSPLRFRDSKPLRSLFNQNGSVTINDITALERSSNVYMARLAMRMGGEYSYSDYQSLPFSGSNLLSKQREYYAQFGLGVETGIDLPFEATGYKGTNPTAINGLTNAFGQYDTYTTIQLLQYVSTIANDGVRIAPKLVSEIRDTDPDTGGVGPLKTEIEPKILNTVPVTEDAMKRVQQGFYQVVHGTQGTARSYFQNTPYESAGKTGTAEAFWYNEDTKSSEEAVNLTYVGYAPYDDPEIAIAVVVPFLPASSSQRTNHENTVAARRVMDAYFKVGEFETDNSGVEETVEDIQSAAEEAQNDEE